MSKHNSFWFKSLRWLQNKIVHTVVVPQDPFSDLNLDLNRPLIYVLKTESVSDLAVLNKIAVQFGLPNPYTPLEIEGKTLPRVVCLKGAKPLFGKRKESTSFLDTFTEFLALHKQNHNLDIQLVPVSLFWGRTPGRDDDTMKAAVLEREDPSWLRKMLMILFLGRHNFLQFSNAVSLKYMAQEHGTDQRIAHKLARVARVHFQRQRKVMTGPALPNRQALFHSLLNAENIKLAIAEEAISKKIPEAEAQAKASEYIDEIAADYSDSLVRIAERLLTWLWNKLYSGINIKGAEQIRKLHHDGHEIVYVPCHRSHMDYLLLSYILYFQGMVPPHIAAGINLNFWPAGPLFRRGGAFFIRRSFNGNKLYTAVFREYLDQLFAKGYSVEYFTEGGRSRTGRLLTPKTGMIAMTVNSVLRGIKRPVTMVPVYLGYDHVMEVATYHKELSGKKKQKESIWQILSAIRKLGNFGQGYVNFGQPINIQNFLSEQVNDWREQVAENPDTKPSWLNPTVNSLANQVMTNINDAAAASSVTLNSIVLLAAEQNALERSVLEKQLNLYLKLLKQAPYTEYASVAQGDGTSLVEQALSLNKIMTSVDGFGEIISIEPNQLLAMSYYRNNIIHLLILPALIASCLIRTKQPTRVHIYKTVNALYPLLKAELFMGIDNPQAYTDEIIELLIKDQLISEALHQAEHLVINQARFNQLLLLSGIISETLQRYAIIFNLLASKPVMERSDLEGESHLLAQRLGALHGVTAPEFYDKKLYGTLTLKLKDLGYLTDKDDNENIVQMRDDINALLQQSIKQTIIESVNTAS